MEVDDNIPPTGSSQEYGEREDRAMAILKPQQVAGMLRRLSQNLEAAHSVSDLSATVTETHDQSQNEHDTNLPSIPGIRAKNMSPRTKKVLTAFGLILPVTPASVSQHLLVRQHLEKAGNDLRTWALKHPDRSGAEREPYAFTLSLAFALGVREKGCVGAARRVIRAAKQLDRAHVDFSPWLESLTGTQVAELAEVDLEVALLVVAHSVLRIFLDSLQTQKLPDAWGAPNHTNMELYHSPSASPKKHLPAKSKGKENRVPGEQHPLGQMHPQDIDSLSVLAMCLQTSRPLGY